MFSVVSDDSELFVRRPDILVAAVVLVLGDGFGGLVFAGVFSALTDALAAESSLMFAIVVMVVVVGADVIANGWSPAGRQCGSALTADGLSVGRQRERETCFFRCFRPWLVVPLLRSASNFACSNSPVAPLRSSSGAADGPNDVLSPPVA